MCTGKVIEQFILQLHLFSGTYGTVFKAKNRETLEIVAMKRVRLDDDDEVRTCGFHCTEKIVFAVFLFHQLQSPNHYKFKKIISKSHSLYYVGFKLKKGFNL